MLPLQYFTAAVVFWVLQTSWLSSKITIIIMIRKFDHRIRLQKRSFLEISVPMCSFFMVTLWMLSSCSQRASFQSLWLLLWDWFQHFTPKLCSSSEIKSHLCPEWYDGCAFLSICIIVWTDECRILSQMEAQGWTRTMSTHHSSPFLLIFPRCNAIRPFCVKVFLKIHPHLIQLTQMMSAYQKLPVLKHYHVKFSMLFKTTVNLL